MYLGYSVTLTVTWLLVMALTLTTCLKIWLLNKSMDFNCLVSLNRLCTFWECLFFLVATLYFYKIEANCLVMSLCITLLIYGALCLPVCMFIHEQNRVYISLQFWVYFIKKLDEYICISTFHLPFLFKVSFQYIFGIVCLYSKVRLLGPLNI